MPAAWPFASSYAPNLDTGPETAVPVGAADVFTGDLFLIGAHFTNEGAVSITITVTSTIGKVLCKLKLPAGGEQPYEWPFRPVTGVRWSADGVGVVGHVWGYQ